MTVHSTVELFYIMPFFGLIWTTSWVSCLLASSQGLLRVPDYITNALPTKVLSVVNSPLEQPRSPFFSSPVYSNVWSNKSSVTALANSGLANDLGSLPFPFAQTATVAAHPFRDTAQSVSCPAKSDFWMMGANPNLAMIPHRLQEIIHLPTISQTLVYPRKSGK